MLTMTTPPPPVSMSMLSYLAFMYGEKEEKAGSSAQILGAGGGGHPANNIFK